MDSHDSKKEKKQRISTQEVRPSKRWNEEFIEVLGQLAKLLASQGEVFKSRAYKKAEETVRSIGTDIVEVAQLKGKPGIGTTILEKLQEYMNTGTLQLLEREKGKPEYLFADIHGVGPKKARDLVAKGVTTLAELRERQDELLNDVQKKGLKYFEDIQRKIPRSEIDEYHAVFEKAFKQFNGKMGIVGSYRRGAAQSGDIDVIVTASDPTIFTQFMKALDPIIVETLSCGNIKCLVIAKLPSHKYARRVDFMYTSVEEYPFAILYFTGSKTFNTVMRGNALKQGFSLNEHGLYAMVKGKKGAKNDNVFKDEKAIFYFLKMPYREPMQRNEGNEDREASLEIAQRRSVSQKVKKIKEPKAENTKKVREPKVKEPNVQEPKVREPKKEKTKKIREPTEQGTLKKRGRPKKIKMLEPVAEPVAEPLVEPLVEPSVEPLVPVIGPDFTKMTINITTVPLRDIIRGPTLHSGPFLKNKKKKLLLPFQEMIKKSPKKEIKVTSVHNKTVRKMSDKPASKKRLVEFKKSGMALLETLSEKEIETMIIVANDAYYNSKTPLLSDNGYDILREYGENKYPQNETIKQVGAPITKNKVTLPYNMPSMDKIKPDSNALSTWMQKYKGPYVLSCKLDGVSGLYTTEGGEPKLYTRGDGTVGQDVSHLLRSLKLPPKEGEGAAVRGEFILPKRVFDEKYKDRFANPRNLVSGIVNSKTIDDKTHDLHFVTYEVIHPPLKISEQMAMLQALGHEVVRNEEVESLSNDILSKTLLDWRSNYEYEIDGVIVADDHIHPRKDHNPEHAFAFKMVISDQMAEAKVVDVLWEPSKSGYLKPRVQIEPIKLGGVTIQYVTGFNGDFIEKNRIGVGAIIQIIRSGDVIPHIKSVTTPAEIVKMPDVPYTWTKNHVDIVLENVDQDITVRRKNITEFFTKLEVDGLSGKTVEKIMDAGYDTVPKMLKMDKADFAKVKGFKETLTNKIHDGIQNQVEKATLLDIMAASNMFGRGIGERKIQPILEAEPTILTDEGTTEAKYERLLRIKGIGKENARSFTQNIDRFMQFLKEGGLESKIGMTKIAEESVLVDKSHPYYGKHFVFSGGKDAELIKELESVGAIVDDSIGRDTFMLIVKSLDDKETSKVKYAKKHEIPIMVMDELRSKLV